MRTKRIAGVSVNLDSLPTEENLIKKALKTKDFIYKRDALKLIKAEIKASGIYKAVKPKSEKPKKTNTRSSKQSVKG